MRYALAVLCVTVGLAVAAWLHGHDERYTYCNGQTGYGPYSCTSTGIGHRHPSWADPLAVLVAGLGIAGGVALVATRRRVPQPASV